MFDDAISSVFYYTLHRLSINVRKYPGAPRNSNFSDSGCVFKDFFGFSNKICEMFRPSKCFFIQNIFASRKRCTGAKKKLPTNAPSLQRGTKLVLIAKFQVLKKVRGKNWAFDLSINHQLRMRELRLTFLQFMWTCYPEIVEFQLPICVHGNGWRNRTTIKNEFSSKSPFILYVKTHRIAHIFRTRCSSMLLNL